MPFEYEAYVFETAQVDTYGAIWWNESRMPGSLALRGERLGLRFVGPHWEVYEGSTSAVVKLGTWT